VFQTQLPLYFSKSDNKSNHHHTKLKNSCKTGKKGKQRGSKKEKEREMRG